MLTLRVYLFLGVLLGGGVSTLVWAQPRPLPGVLPGFERLDGLSHNTVFSILQDRQGFLWIGTSDGLNRYDGYTFTVYRHIPGEVTSLSNNTIKALLEDRQGVLWIGTDGGLNRFDRRTERFRRHGLQPNRPASHEPAVLALLEDRQERVWVGTGEGLYRYTRDTDRFDAYRDDPDDPNSLAAADIWSLYEGRDGTLWIGTSQSATLHRYNPQTDQFTRFVLPSTWQFISVLYEDDAGRLWLTSEAGAKAFDPISGQLSPLPGVPAGQAVRTVLEDRRGRRWIGTQEGLYRHDPPAREPLHLRVEATPGTYLQNSIKTLFEDQAGTLWVGTFSGLYHHDPRAKPFQHLGYHPEDLNSLSSNTVMAIWEDADGVLWVGTLGGGLNRVDRLTGAPESNPGQAVRRYRHRPGDAHSLCHDRIWSLFGDRRGRLWIGTDAGLCAFDRHTGRFMRYALPHDPSAARQPPINAIREDEAGRLWVAGNAGLYRLDPATGEATWYTRPGNEAMTSSTFFVQSLQVDRAGAVWMGTFGGGLYRLDPETDTFTRYALLLAEDEELVSEGLWALHEDRDGTLWLGSDLGLTRLDPRTGATRHFTQRDGLPGSIIYGILQDEVLGRLWLSTNAGLARFDDRLPKNRRVRVYDRGDGIGNAEFNRRAAFKGRDGTFYFGGLEGLTWFHPTAIRDNRVVPPVVLTYIESSNRDTTVAINPFGLDELILSYRDYTLSFEFAALSFTDPSKNRYRYRLDNFDDGWIEAGTTRRARYTNIPPGRYVFRLQGSNNDGVWNETGASLAVVVTPPFWQTWWFRLLIVGLVVGMLVAAHRYRVARLLEVERMRMRIAGDLHDDVGSGLSSIALASELAGRDPDLSEDKRRHFALVTNRARQLANALTDIVWLVDPAQDRLEDLVEHMEEVTRTLLVGIDYTFERPAAAPSHPIGPNVRRNVYLLYKEILHNIVKHAQATTVDITLALSSTQVVLTVADNGIGFEKAAMHNGYGLRNMQHRAVQMGGSLALSGCPGEGTTVRFTARLS